LILKLKDQDINIKIIQCDNPGEKKFWKINTKEKAYPFLLNMPEQEHHREMRRWNGCVGQGFKKKSEVESGLTVHPLSPSIQTHISNKSHKKIPTKMLFGKKPIALII
jgi:hypothetical protein